MTNQESFLRLIGTDKTVAAKFEQLVETLTAASKHPITRDQLASLTSVRMAALTLSDIDQVQFDTECDENLEVFRRSNEEAEQIAILMDKNIAQAEAAEQALGLADMAPDQRLAYARANNLISTKAAPTVERPTNSDQEEAAIAECNRYSGGARIAAARRLGLL